MFYMFCYVLPYCSGGESGGQQCPAETTPLTKARRTGQGTSVEAPHDESDGGPLRPTASSPVTSDKRRRCSQRLGRALVTRPALSARVRVYRDGRLGMDIYRYHPRYGCCAVAGVHTAQGVPCVSSAISHH